MKIKIGDLLEITKNLFPVANQQTMNDEEMPLLGFGENLLMARNETVQVEAKFNHEFEFGAIPFYKFQKLLSVYHPNSKINIHSKNKKLFVEGRNKNKAVIPYIETVFQPIKRSLKWEDLPTNFFRGLSICETSLTDKQLSWVLTRYGIFNDYIVSSDEKRLTRFELAADSFPIPFSLSKSTVETLWNLDFDLFSLNRKSFQAKTTDGIYYLKAALISEKYPSHEENIFHPKKKELIITNKEKFEEALKRTLIFTESTNKDKEADFIFTMKELKIKSENDFGKNEERITLKREVKRNFKVRANPQFLIEIIQQIERPKLFFRISNEGLFVFREKDFSHAIAAIIGKKENENV